MCKKKEIDALIDEGVRRLSADRPVCQHEWKGHLIGCKDSHVVVYYKCTKCGANQGRVHDQ